MSVPVSIYRFTCVIYLIGASGLMMELTLLEHFESFWQTLSLFLVGFGLLSLTVQYFGADVSGARWMNSSAILQVIGGLLGIYMHLDNNLEFEQELRPNVIGWKLWWNALKGAVPATAPGALILLGSTGRLIVLMKKQRVEK